MTRPLHGNGTKRNMHFGYLTRSCVQALDKRKAAWHKQHAERAKAREASSRAQAAAEKAREREKTAVQQSLVQCAMCFVQNILAGCMG